MKAAQGNSMSMNEADTEVLARLNELKQGRVTEEKAA